MNPQKSALQQQYPLSPRKFWKKMIMGLYVWYILIGIAIITISVIYFFNNSDSLGGKAYAGLFISSILFIIPLVIITLPYAWYIKVYIRRYYYDGEENFITIKKGVFAPGEIHVQWQKIQDVYVDQDILDRIMGLYDVHIASATTTSGIEAHIDGVDQAAAEGLKKFLLEKVSSAGRNNFQGNIGAQPTNPVEPPKPILSKINLNEDISSNTYPLLGKWTILALFSRLVSSFILPAFIVFIFFRELAADYWIYLVLGWLALSVLMMIVNIIILFLWIKNYAFNFTPEHIYYREGVISMSEKHMPYSSIQDVTVKQGIIERLFGLAKVVIQNAAQQPIMVDRRGKRTVGFAGVIIQGLSLADANKITNILKTTVLGRNTSHFGL